MLQIQVFIVVLFLSKVLLQNNTANQFNINFQQNDYKIIYERAEVSSYNKHYIQSFTLATFKFNRTCTAFNVSGTFNVELGNNLEMIAQSYRFASNEYRLFPMRFQFNVCDALSKNVFGFKRFLACGNFTGCPLEKKKSYRICNFTPDESRFPPLIPNGRYMIELQAIYFSNELAVVRCYVEITRPFTWK